MRGILSAEAAQATMSWIRRAGDRAAASVDLVLWCPVAMGAGIALYFSLPLEIPVALGLVTTLCLVAFHVWAGQGWGRKTRLLLIFLVLGLLIAQLRAADVAAPVLDGRMGPVTVEGRVLRWEEEGKGQGRLTLSDLGIERLSSEMTPERIRIVLRTGGDRFDPGDRVRLPAILDAPPQPVFPGDYDYARSLYFERIGALGFAVGPLEVIRKSPSDKGWQTRIETFRTRLSARIRTVLPGESGAVADALITGSRQALSDDVTEAMRGSGLAHLLAISGLHLGIVTGLVFFVLRGLLALVPRIALNYPIKKWAAAAAIPIAAFYLLMSGSGIPTTRAFIMVSLVMCAIMLDRNPISLRLVAVAAVLILLMTPEALLSASFQMSFAAVTGLVAAFAAVTEYKAVRARRRLAGTDPDRRRGLGHRLAIYFLAIAGTTIVAEIVLMPPTLYHFNRTALYGLAGNLLAMPLVGFWIMPAAVVAMLLMPLGLEEVPLTLMGHGIDQMLMVARSLSTAPGAEFLVPAFSTGAYACIMIGLIAICLFKGWLRILGVPLILAGTVFAVWTPRPDILIGGDAKVMAVKAPDGRYWFSPGLAGRHARRVAADWNGQWEQPRWEWRTGQYKEAGPPWLSCDVRGCLYRPNGAGGMIVALVHDPLAAREDCGQARVVLSFENLGPHCTAPDLLLHWPDIRKNGGHAIYLNSNGEIDTATTRQFRGARPWVPEGNR